MSAFICGDKHIASLVFWYGVEKDLPIEVFQFIANELKKVNIKSVNYRYDDNVRITQCKLSKAIPISSEEALSMAACLEYQSCELKDYQNPILQSISDLAKSLADPKHPSDIWELY